MKNFLPKREMRPNKTFTKKSIFEPARRSTHGALRERERRKERRKERGFDISLSAFSSSYSSAFSSEDVRFRRR